MSIVVPVYNAEKYLDQCVTSIMGQTYRHLEIILVNDGSTDHSLEICRKYAEIDERITVVEQINQGVVKARKTGVEAATGDFIGWADADDWLESGYIEGLVKLQ